MRTALICLSMGLMTTSAQAMSDHDKVVEVVGGIIKKNCVECHGEKKQKGRLRLDTIDLLKPTDTGLDHLLESIEQVRLLDMPPEDHVPGLADKDRETLIEGLELIIKKVQEDQVFQEKPIATRLTRKQFVNNLESLLHVQLLENQVRSIPADSLSEEGFRNNGRYLNIGSTHLLAYEKVIDECIEAAMISKDEKMHPMFAVRYDLKKMPPPKQKPLTKERKEAAEKNAQNKKKQAERLEAALKKMTPEKRKLVLEFEELKKLGNKMLDRLSLRPEGEIISSPLTSISDTPDGWRHSNEFVKAKDLDYNPKSKTPKFGFAVVRAGYGDYPRYWMEKEAIVLRPVHLKNEVKGDGRRGLSPNFCILFHEAMPQRGYFRIKVTAAKWDDSPKNPTLEMHMGTGEQSTFKKVGSQTVTGAKGEYKVYHFKGSFEDYLIYKELKRSKKNEAIYPTIMALNGPGTRNILEKSPALAIKSIQFEGPFYDGWPTKSHRSIFVKSKNENNPKVYAKEILSSFLKKAHGGKSTPEDLKGFGILWRSLYAESRDFEQSIKATLTAILLSPKFLYRIYDKSEEGDQLSNDELIAQISYFLWNKMPTEGLLDLYPKGQKLTKENLDELVDKMIDNPKFDSFIQSFVKEWLSLDRGLAAPHDVLYSRQLKSSVQEEPFHFVRHLFDEDLSAFNVIDSDFLILNQVLAEWYGIEGVEGAEFRKISLPRNHPRGGVLTMALPMIAQSDDLGRSHPIRRGVWLVERVLGRHIPPPPQAVEFPELNEKFLEMNLKEQLEFHMKDKNCAGCHRRIDPYGIPFENFGGYGEWRETIKVFDTDKKRKQTLAQKEPFTKYTMDAHGYETGPVDATTKLKGSNINGIHDLKKHILKDCSHEVSRTLVRFTLEYALGRTLTSKDAKYVDEINAKFKESKYSMRSLVKEVVHSSLFQAK